VSLAQYLVEQLTQSLLCVVFYMCDFFFWFSVLFVLSTHKLNLINSTSSISISVLIIRESQPYQNKHKCGASYPATDQIHYDARTASLVMQ
jgi:hypothetical protein